jgi:O-antigen ligase
MIDQEYYNPNQAVEVDYPALGLQDYVATQGQLFAVIIYIIAQGFTIPVLPIGPSWATWPRLDDFATLLLLFVFLTSHSRIYPMTKRERFFFAMWVVLLLVSFPSTLYGRAMRPELEKSFNFGISQTFRIFEYGLVWVCIRGMAFSQKQLDTITKTLFCVLIFVIIICVGNVTGLIPPSRLVFHLPYAGHWMDVKLKTGPSTVLGPFGYNYAYTACQLTFMAAVMLAATKPRLGLRILMVVAIVAAIFLSGSRGPMVGFAVAIAIWASKGFRQLLFFLAMIIIGAIGFSLLVGSVRESVRTTAVERAATFVSPEEDPTLGGRVPQWRNALNIIREDTGILMTGVGWGYANQVLGGIGKAHMMVLQTLIELGIFGLLLYLLFLFGIYRLLLGKDRLKRALRSAFLGLLVASSVSETFYPVPMYGSFLGFVLCLVAIAGAAERGRNIEEQCYEEYELSEEGDFSYSYSM